MIDLLISVNQYFAIIIQKDYNMARKPTVKVKAHKRTQPDGICSNNLKPKKCSK
jgi:hypothetical protein